MSLDNSGDFTIYGLLLTRAHKSNDYVTRTRFHVPLTPLGHLPPTVYPALVIYFVIKPRVTRAELSAHLKEIISHRTFL